MKNRPQRIKTLNPFYHRVELTLWDKIKIGLFTVTLLPIKILLLIPFLCLAELLVLIGLSGITFEESQSTQLSKWRRVVRWIIAHLVMKSIVFCSGFIWKIKETGKRATPEEAPIFVVGPHSSYFDSFVVILLGSPSIVAKLDTKDVPIFGRLVTFTQAVYVTRESKESRKQVMEALKQRAQGVFNGNGMPQIYIYPEGTTGNRSSLIKFKPGAFVPQVPVQPVLIRYPNVFDAVTYTFDGLSLKQNIWYALAQLYVNVEVEYLPVYVPSEAEKNDPNLFAENVRSVMSESLRIPMSDYQFEDGTLLSALRDETKFLHKLQTIHQAKKVFGVLDYRVETAMLLRGQGSIYMRQMNWRKNFVEFQAQFYNMGSEISSIPKVRDVFNSFTKNGEDSLDVRPYLVLASLLCNNKRYGSRS
ncbi:Lysophosphatidylcholine acyltransferase 1 [Orchesella cincta]|uniref:Lysophosphatidylcholine acyltransferase 1 n=1 Tax=Orchesella cincta TaxID=48709 RepID=A0A1D2N144_ORCCI|nr:Lysophosphatidylcholine acyltransferase 1 [Orchesella cincta]